MAVAPRTLTSLLSLVTSPSLSDVEYVVGGVELSDRDRETAAFLVADKAMQVACGPSPVLDRWRRRRDGGPPEQGSPREAVKTFVGIGFGNPAKPPNVDHLQGHVAELMWNLLIAERQVASDGRQLVRAHSVKADPLEPGGDGLVIYLNPNDILVFRLWEIKKHDAQRGVSATINRASKQLALRGHEYLAKLAAPETIADDDLGMLYGVMVDLWFDRSERAGVGVAIGTSDTHAPPSARSFASIRRAFPSFLRSDQTEAIVLAIPDYPAFAERVKDIVWSGL